MIPDVDCIVRDVGIRKPAAAAVVSRREDIPSTGPVRLPHAARRKDSCTVGNVRIFPVGFWHGIPVTRSTGTHPRVPGLNSAGCGRPRQGNRKVPDEEGI